MDQNRWPLSIRISGHFEPESLAGMGQNMQADPKTKSFVEIFNEKTYFSLIEDAKRADHILTSAERRQKQDGSLWGAPRYDYSPSGKLSLIIDVPGAVGIRKKWADSPKSRLEELLGDFVNATILIAHILKKERLIREEENRKWEEELIKKAEDEKRQREEEARFYELEKQAEQWAKSERLRLFIRAVEREVAKIDADKESSARFAKWLSWAKGHADRLDPIKCNLSTRIK